MDNKADFDRVLEDFLDSITNRKLDVYKSYVTDDDVMYTIVQNGQAFTTPQELIALHEEWFRDPDWVWEGSVIRKVVGMDMAFVLLKYDYRAKKEDAPVSTWLTYVFRLEDTGWRVIHDHNTALGDS